MTRIIKIWLKDEVIDEDDNALMWILDHSNSVKMYEKSEEEK